MCSIRILAKNIGDLYYEPLLWFMTIVLCDHILAIFVLKKPSEF